MSRSSKQPEIETLVAALCEDRFGAAEAARLDALLRDDPDAQRFYLEEVDLHHSLQWDVASQATREAYRTVRAAGLPPDGVSTQTQPIGRIAPWRPAWAAAALLALGLTLAGLLSRSKSDRPAAPPSTAALAPAVAYVIASDVETWQVGSDLHRGVLEVPQGVLRFRFESGAVLTARGPARLDLRDVDRVRLERGTVLLSTGQGAGGFRLEAPGATLVESGTETGLRVDERGATRVSVLGGQVAAEVTDRFVGMPQVMHLTRDDGLRIDAQGVVTEAIVADDSIYTPLRPADGATPSLANASFEYPQAAGAESIGASGWTILSHPLANAEGMRVSAGLVPGGRDGAPKVAHGRQWVYLQARTFDDGRTAHNSLHQQVGVLEHDTRSRLRLTVGWFAQVDRNASYTVGLYTGSAMGGPREALHVWRQPVVPPAGGAAEVDVTYHAPLHSPYRGRPLFVVIEAAAGATPGVRRVLIDHVRLEVLPKENAQ